jgi:hypothetical protein
VRPAAKTSDHSRTSGALEPGFEVDAIYGDWARTSFTPDASFMVFIAHVR